MDTVPQPVERARPRRARSRYREIGGVLARHGLGFVVSALGVQRFIPFSQRLFGGGQTPAPSSPEHVRLALEELGPTFIKLGQILSTRADLLPPEYINELARLRDAAPPMPAEEVVRTIVRDLGGPPEQVFQMFDPKPLAAASIGEVHAATLPDGSAVAVKIRRPGVVDQIELDLSILRTIAATATRRSQFAAHYDLVGLVEEFARTLRSETDYRKEAENAERFARNFAGNPMVRIPRVHWAFSTERVLTLERVSGIKIDDVEALDRAGIRRPAVARRDARMVLTMVFRHGFFHADPHPGNFFVGPDASIGLMDFGMVGLVDDRTRDQLVWALLAFISPDIDRQVDILFEVGVARRRADREQLRRDVQHLRARYYGRAVGDIPIREAINDGLAVVRRHRLQLPPNFALLLKTIAMHEGLVRRLDPSFDFTAVVLPYTRRLLVRHLSPAVLARWTSQAAMDWARLGLELPQQTRRLLSQLERGDLEVAMRPSSFEPLVQHLERIAFRLTLVVVGSALVVAIVIAVVLAVLLRR